LKFDYCLAGRDLYFVADKDCVSGDLPARFVVSWSPIREVGSLYDCFFELLNIVDSYHVGETQFIKFERFLHGNQTVVDR